MTPPEHQGPRPDSRGLAPERLLEALPDAIAVLGPSGEVNWANEQASRLLRLPLDQLVGSDGLSRLHPEEVAKALDGIAWAATYPERTAVVPYRLRRGDDTYVTVELKSTVVAGDDGDHLVLMLRDGTTRSTLAAALASIASGAPVEETARWLVAAIESRWPETVAAVVYGDDGGARVSADSLDPGLGALLLAADPDVATPWVRAVEIGGPLVAAEDELPEPVRSAALALGFRAVACVPAVDPEGSAAIVVAWFDQPEAAHFEWPHWASEVSELLTLALERRSHQRHLVESARRDPLTGLFNRTGLFEGAAALLGGASAIAAEGATVGLLYVDLDGFKPVNDRLGHAAGDAVLAEIARRLASAVPGSLVARLGGDEFAVVVAAASPGGAPLDVGAVADALLAAIEPPIPVSLGARDSSTIEEVVLGASIGVATVDALDDAARVDEVLAAALRAADAAMYEAKRAGRGTWRRATRGTGEPGT